MQCKRRTHRVLFLSIQEGSSALWFRQTPIEHTHPCRSGMLQDESEPYGVIFWYSLVSQRHTYRQSGRVNDQAVNGLFAAHDAILAAFRVVKKSARPAVSRLSEWSQAARLKDVFPCFEIAHQPSGSVGVHCYITHRFPWLVILSATCLFEATQRMGLRMLRLCLANRLMYCVTGGGKGLVGLDRKDFFGHPQLTRLPGAARGDYPSPLRVNGGLVLIGRISAW